MNKILKILSIVVFVSSIGLWALQGANTGWTKTEREIQQVDEITGIEYTEYEKKLTLGIELPVAGTIAAVLLFGTALFFKKPESSMT